MSEGITSLIPLVLIFVIFYFFLIRPQQKKVKEHKLMVESLKMNFNYEKLFCFKKLKQFCFENERHFYYENQM